MRRSGCGFREIILLLAGCSLWMLPNAVVAFVVVPVASKSRHSCPAATINDDIDHTGSTSFRNDNYSWDQNYQLLKQFYEQFGHTNVPINWGHPQLKDWVKQQKQNCQLPRETTPHGRRKKLAMVGITSATTKPPTPASYPPMFVTDFQTGKKFYASAWEQKWEDMYEMLVQFKQQHGFVNCNTKKGYKLDLKLALWVQIQRENLYLNAIRNDRRAKLEAIGLEPLFAT